MGDASTSALTTEGETSHSPSSMLTEFQEMTNSTASVSTTAAKTAFDYDNGQMAMWIFDNNWKIVSPPGIIGNLIILIVTIRMKPFNSSSLFMVSLATVDMLLVCGRPGLREMDKYSDAACQSIWYIFNVLPVYSNYILLFWTLERFIAVQFPLRVNDWCTLRNTAFSITGAGVFAVLYCLPWLLSFENDPTSVFCQFRDHWQEFMFLVYFYMETAFLMLIPMLAILFLNIGIIYRLKASTKRHKTMTSSEEANKQREKVQRNMTISLLTVSFAFILLHTPMSVHNLASFVHFETTEKERADWLLLNACSYMLFDAQNSVNFYLYFLSGRKYRQHTLALLCFWRRRSGMSDSRSERKTALTSMSMKASTTTLATSCPPSISGSQVLP